MLAENPHAPHPGDQGQGKRRVQNCYHGGFGGLLGDKDCIPRFDQALRQGRQLHARASRVQLGTVCFRDAEGTVAVFDTGTNALTNLDGAEIGDDFLALLELLGVEL